MPASARLQRRPVFALAGAVGLLLALLPACSCETEATTCARDGECADGEVCLPQGADGRCVPVGVAGRMGADVGDECVTSGGHEYGCDEGVRCQLGHCQVTDGGGGGGGCAADSTLLFGGASEATADGPDAVVLRWFAAADPATPAAEVAYLVYSATAAGAEDFTAEPLATVVGETSYRAAGLTTGTTYYFVVRARDSAGRVGCNEKELSATPAELAACADWDVDVGPLLAANCTSCHSGAEPPASLHLDSYEGTLAGGVTGSEVIACQAAASLIYLKVSMDTPPVGERMPRGGPYLSDSQVATIERWISSGARRSCEDPGPCDDTTPPAFAGAASATLSADGGSAQVCWTAASDDSTSPDALVYDLYVGGAPGEQDFGAPPATISDAGATCADVTGLTPGATYCWVVRARDEAGNRDGNTVEVCVTVPAADCVEYATVIQPLFDARCTACHSGAAPPAGLTLTSREGALAGGITGNEVVACRPETSLLWLKVSLDAPPVGARMPFGGPYLGEPQLAAIEQWIVQGARASCAEADPCSDATPPVFGGASSAELAPDGTSAQLCWTAATDDGTAAAGLVYVVYEGDASGGQDFAAAPQLASDPGATCVDRTGLTPGQEYCWVVRARDAAGNEDGNLAEWCLTAPAAACIDYATMIQPIFDARCIRCHAGAGPPAGLHLDSYAGVLAGGMTGGEVIACQPDSSLLFQKISMQAPPVGGRMPADGPPYLSDPQIAAIRQWIDEGARTDCGAPDVCSDAIPPVFAGLQSATPGADGTSAELCWAAATDDATPQGSLLYDVFAARSAGGQNFGAPASETSLPGQSCVTAAGLTPGQEYCWVVRARDAAGNRDANLAEQCLTMPAASCVDFATMVQPIFDGNCVRCHSGAGPPAGLHLDSWAGVIAGGTTGGEVIPCQPASSLLFQKISMGAPPVGARMPADGPPYLGLAQISLIEQWIAEGGRPDCAAPDVCSDGTPPSFAGIGSAVQGADGTSAQLCWGAGTDDVTATAALLYDVYAAGAPGGQDLGRPAALTSAPGQTCVDATGLTPGQQYCWVVHARDGAGNRDGNSAEQCLTMPAAACVDYATMIQPILDGNCTRCHSGASAPAGLHLDSHAGVLAGGLTGGEVIPCQPASSLLYMKVSMSNPPVGARMPADGPPYLGAAQIAAIEQWIAEGARTSCGAPDVCSDVTPPQFAGLGTATPGADGTSAQLCWAAATDDTTAQASLLYDVFAAASTGAQDFGRPATLTTAPGQSCVGTTGLTPGQQYCWVVRARDGAGNRDGNLVEQCLVMPAASCVDYATMVQPIFDGNCVRCHGGASPPAGLHLDSYAGVVAGGSTGGEVIPCQPFGSLLYQKISQANPPVGARMPADGPPYLGSAQIATIEQWLREGARTSCAAPDVCSDVTPPTFAGIVTATEGAGGTSAQLCWAPGSDDVTVPADLLYDVYAAGAAGGQDFGRPAALTSAPGQSCVTAAGLTPGQTYCWVVRARDGAGNRDGNGAEQCLTLPAAACIDFASMVQPIFDGNCVRCHSGAAPPAGLRLDTYAGVLAGGNTGGEVIPCQPASSLVYQKISMAVPPVGARMPADGPPYLAAAQIATIEQWLAEGARTSCAAPDVCSDVTPPVFAGVNTATQGADGTSAQLCWAAGTDDVTATGALLYDVYAAGAPGGEDFGRPAALTSAPGQTCVTATGLTPGQETCWVVKARDGAGNRDANLAERCLTMPAATCVDFATMVQPIFTANCVRCHSGAAPPAGLHLDSHAGVMAGGITGGEVIPCQPASSLLFQKISMASPPVGVRMPADGPPYLAAGQITIIEQWIAEGARTGCAAPDVCSDTNPPAFGGLTSVTAPNAATAELCWTAGTDDVTPQAELVYDVYGAGASGGQSFAGRATATSPPGAVCVQVPALSPGSRTCWVVRARDAAGNRDANVVEQCFTQPALPAGCVDYATMIQPILDANCLRCHSGTTPPQWLRLGSYDELFAGSSRRNEVIACNASGSLLVDKIEANPTTGDRMPRDGPPYLTASQIAMVRQWITNGAVRSCAEAAGCADAAAPSFAGVTSVVALDETTVRVCWNPATDATIPQASIRYDLYEAATPGAQLFGSPAQESVTGQTCTDVRTGPNSQLCFVVRARDRRGNADANLVELCATTPNSPCAVEYQELVRPILAARCTYCHEGYPAPRFLDLTTYAGIREAGSLRDEVVACDWAASRLNLKTAGNNCGRRMPRDGSPWLAPSEIATLRRWVESGAREDCAEPSPCADVQAPQFAGASSVTDVDGTTVELCWAAATDDTTAASQIVYDVYESATPGGERYTRPSSYAVSGGETCTFIDVPDGQQSCYVVRARDLKGNRDANVVERCVTPAQACLDYSSLVQPIFDARCVHCHSGNGAPRGIEWDTFANAINTGDVRGCDANQGNLLDMVESCEMPYDTASGQCSTVACLTPSQQRLLRAWIMEGANQSCPNGGCP